MDIKTEILFRQSEELMILRERSIENIYSSANSFLTFLGLTATALAIFIDVSIPEFGKERIDLIEHITLICIGLAIFFYGWFIYRHIWSFYVGQIKYTRMLNMTRAYLTKNLDMSRILLLPTSRNRPGFDDQGYLGKNFSKNGVVSWIKWANTIIMGLTIYTLAMVCQRIPIVCERVNVHMIAPVIGLIGARVVFLRHNYFNKKILHHAKQNWIEKVAKNKERGYSNIC